MCIVTNIYQTWLQNGHDLALALVGHGRQGQDGLALAVGADGGAAEEVHLPADAGEHARADRVGHDLAGEVDLDARVDGRDLGVHRYQVRRVCVAHVGHDCK